MPAFVRQANPGGQPSAPGFTDRIDITFATPADDYLAGGYLIGLAARIGVGKTLLDVTATSFTTATGAWDGRHWKYNPTTDRLQAFGENSVQIADATNVSAATVRLVATSF